MQRTPCVNCRMVVELVTDAQYRCQPAPFSALHRGPTVGPRQSHWCLRLQRHLTDSAPLCTLLLVIGCDSHNSRVALVTLTIRELHLVQCRHLRALCPFALASGGCHHQRVAQFDPSWRCCSQPPPSIWCPPRQCWRGQTHPTSLPCALTSGHDHENEQCLPRLSNSCTDHLLCTAVGSVGRSCTEESASLAVLPDQ